MGSRLSGRDAPVEAILGLEGRTILLVTDNLSVGLIAAKYLHSRGFGVSTAPDADTGLSKFDAISPDVVVIEDFEAGRGSLAVLQQFRAWPSSSSVSIIMGRSEDWDPDVELEATSLGNVRFVADPLSDFDGLLEAIGRAIEEADAAKKYADREAETTQKMLDEMLSGFDNEEDLPPETAPQSSPSQPAQERSSGFSFDVVGSDTPVPSTSSPAPTAAVRRTVEQPAAQPAVQQPAARPAVQQPAVLPPPKRPESKGRLDFALDPVPAAGSLVEVSVAELFARCHATKMTGTVVLTDDTDTRAVCFDRGSPTYVQSATEGQSLASSLASWGQISPEQERNVIAEVESTGRSPNELLLAQGLISPHELFESLTRHVTERLHAVFELCDGTYSIEPPDYCGAEVVPLTLDFTRIFLDGVGTHLDRERIEQRLLISDESRVRLRRSEVARLDRLKFATTEARLVDLVRREMKVGKLSAPGDRDLALRLLYGLYLLGFIGFEGGFGAESTAGSEVGETSERSPSASSVETSRAASSKPLDMAEEQKREELDDLVGVDYFVVLGLDRGASTDEVHKAFRQRVKQYHPDKMAKHSEEVRSLASEVYRLVVDGYQILADERQRAAYIDELTQADKDPGATAAPPGEKASTHEPDAATQLDERSPSDPGAPYLGLNRENAEDLISQAQSAIKDGKFDAAVEAIESAQEQFGDNLRLIAWGGWAKYLANPKKNQRTSERALKKALESNTGHHELNLLSARFYAETGDMERATILYLRAEELAPRDEEVSREARLFHAQAKRGGKGKGLLSQDLGSIFKSIFKKS